MHHFNSNSFSIDMDTLRGLPMKNELPHAWMIAINQTLAHIKNSPSLNF